VRLCRMSTSTLAALTRTSSLSTETTSRTDIRTPVTLTDACKDSSWPERSFPLVDADYDRLAASELSSDSRCHTCTSVCDGLIVADGSSMSAAGPVVTEDSELTAVTSQSMVHSTPDVTPVTTL